MSERENIDACFAPILSRLAAINMDLLPQLEYSSREIFEASRERVFSYDLEEVEDTIHRIIARIEAISTGLHEKIERKDYNFPEPDPLADLDESRSYPIQTKESIEVDIRKELELFKTWLSELETEIVSYRTQSGNSVNQSSNLRIEFELTTNELGAFFNALYDSGLIKSQKKDGSRLNKSDLARFISNHCLNNDGKQLSTGNIQRNLLHNNQPVTDLTEKKLNDFLRRVKATNWFSNFLRLFKNSFQEFQDALSPTLLNFVSTKK